MKRDLWDAVHKCTKCNSSMRKKSLVVEGTNIRGWECVKCKDTVLHPEDAQKMLVLSKLKRGLSVTPEKKAIHCSTACAVRSTICHACFPYRASRIVMCPTRLCSSA